MANFLIICLLIWSIIGFVVGVIIWDDVDKFAYHIKSRYKRVALYLIVAFCCGPAIMALCILMIILVLFVEHVVFNLWEFLDRTAIEPIKKWLLA